MKKLFALALLFLVNICIASAQSPSDLRKKHFNVDKTGLAIEGYDPVSYFTTQKAIEGRKDFTLTMEGVIYRFTSAENRDLFKANPSKYQPQYGGWCAYAMGATGEKVEIDPETFKLTDGKLYLFYNKFFNNTRKSWDKDENNLKPKADANWIKTTR